MKVFFYPHKYLRPRQLDAIRMWPREEILNPDLLEKAAPSHVEKSSALAKGLRRSWKQWLPLINLKPRPKEAPMSAALYVWGGIPLRGPFILDLDTPYATCAYNLHAFLLYRRILRLILESSRCLEIRCMSRACRVSLRYYFGHKVARKARVHYPLQVSNGFSPVETERKACRFLFIGSQFDIKGGESALNAFSELTKLGVAAELDMITYLPGEHAERAESLPGLRVWEPTFNRRELMERFFLRADALIYPTLMDSFGMVALEAVSAGLGVIGTRIYAIPEMIRHGYNGELIAPAISPWDRVLGTKDMMEWHNYKQKVLAIDKRGMEKQLLSAMRRIAESPAYRDQLKEGSRALFRSRFQRA